MQSGNFDAAVKETDNILLLSGKFSADRQILRRNLNYLAETVIIAAGSISSIDTQKFSLIQKQFPLDTHTSVSRLCEQIQLFLSHLPDCMLADDSEEETLNQIIQYVRENYTDSSLSASAVSDRFHVSISWLSVHFKSKTGIGFLDYVHGCRLAKAKDLLYSTNISIKEIALMTGYTNSATFSRAFSRSSLSASRISFGAVPSRLLTSAGQNRKQTICSGDDRLVIALPLPIWNSELLTLPLVSV